MASLTEDILDFAKIEAGMFTLNEKPFEIGALVTEIEFIFENQCNQKGLWLRIDCPETLRHTLFDSDADRIRQVLMNLISNAFKFTNRGGILITLELIADVNNFDHRLLKVKVVDTGVGVIESDK